MVVKIMKITASNSGNNKDQDDGDNLGFRVVIKVLAQNLGD